MDTDLFKRACDSVSCLQRERELIGTLSEKSFHAALKYYFAPCGSDHEIKIGNYYADAVAEDGSIIEIQTRAAYRLKKKLSCFLEISPVTLVLPIPADRYVVWIDPQSGELDKRRKSPKHGKAFDAFGELYGILPLLGSRNLTICVLLANVCDYRLLDGRDKTGKKGSTRYDRFPEKLVDEIYIREPADMLKLLPAELPNEFTVNDLMKLYSADRKAAYGCAAVLSQMGIVNKIGKRGRSDLYGKNNTDKSQGEGHEDHNQE